MQPHVCRSKECSYYRHYLAYGPADLTHDGFHAAERKCMEAQDRIAQWIGDNPDKNPERHPLWIAAEFWEAKVRA